VNAIWGALKVLVINKKNDALRCRTYALSEE
jgi:hypothetical protein